MAALMHRGRRNPRKGSSSAPVNHYVEDAGRRYRICMMPHGRVLMVALKGKRHERFLKIEGRRAGQILRKLTVKCLPVLDSRTAHR